MAFSFDSSSPWHTDDKKKNYYSSYIERRAKRDLSKPTREDGRILWFVLLKTVSTMYSLLLSFRVDFVREDEKNISRIHNKNGRAID